MDMKKPTAKKAEPKKPAAKKAVPKKPTKVKRNVKRYVAVRVNMYHPFERVSIPTAPPGVILEGDSWLESQIEAGLIKVA